MRSSSIGRVALLAIGLLNAGAAFCADESIADQAARVLQSGHPKEAETLVRNALRTQDQPELHRVLADCLEAQGDFKAAALEYRTAATADPSESNLFAFGSELLKYHGYPQALQIFSYAASRFPGSARVIVGLGIAQYSLGQYDQAVAALCRAVDLAPADTRALTFLGSMTGVSATLATQVQARLKDFAERYPDNANALYYYARALPASAPESLHLLQRATALQPQFPEAHFQLGILYQEHKQVAQAVTEFKQAVLQQPALTAAHYRLAQLYRQQGKNDLARQEFALVKASQTAAQPTDHPMAQPSKSAAENK